MKFCTLLFAICFALVLQDASAMIYFRHVENKKTDKINETFGEMTLSEVKIACTSFPDDCQHGFICKGKRCQIVLNTWTGEEDYDENYVFYQKIKDCKGSNCAKSSCSQTDYVKADGKRTRCCPKHKCGTDCKKDVFTMVNGYDLYGYDIHRMNSIEIKACLDECQAKPECVSLVSSLSDGVWQCWLKNVSHVQDKLKSYERHIYDVDYFYLNKCN